MSGREAHVSIRVRRKSGYSRAANELKKMLSKVNGMFWVLIIVAHGGCLTGSLLSLARRFPIECLPQPWNESYTVQ